MRPKCGPAPARWSPKRAKLVNFHLPSEGWIFLQHAKKNNAQASFDRASCAMVQCEAAQAKSSRLATPAGLEPAACRLEGGCSIQLSYGAHRAYAEAVSSCAFF